MHSLKTRFIKNIGFKTLSEVFSRGLTFLILAVMARLLGPPEFGQVSYALALSSLLVIPLDLGWNQLLVRHIASGRDESVVLSVLSLKLKATFLVFIIAILFGFFAQSRIPLWLLMLCMLILIAQYWQDFLAAIAMGREKFHQELFVKSAPRLISVVGMAVFFVWAPTMFALCSVYAWGSTLGIAGVCIFYLPIRKWFSSSISSAQLMTVVRQSLPLGFMTLFWVVYMRVDLVILGAFKVSSSDLGYYGAVSKLMDVARAIPLMQQAALLPIFAGYSGDADRIVKHIIKLNKIILPVVFLVLLGIAGIASFLVDFVYGAEYAEAAPVFQIAIMGTFFSYSNAALMAGLIALRQEKWVLGSSVVLVVVNIVANVILVPFFSIKGAAIAIAFSEFSWLLMNVIIVRRQCKK